MSPTSLLLFSNNISQNEQDYHAGRMVLLKFSICPDKKTYGHLFVLKVPRLLKKLQLGMKIFSRKVFNNLFSPSCPVMTHLQICGSSVMGSGNPGDWIIPAMLRITVKFAPPNWYKSPGPGSADKSVSYTHLTLPTTPYV